MKRHPVLSMDELPSGTMKCAKMDGEEILLANVDGRVYAMANRCTHEDASLCKGVLKGEFVMCPLHGSLFSLANGVPDGDPADEPVRIYPVSVVDNMIYISGS